MSAETRWPLGPVLIGLGGFLVLVALGVWQFSKVQWKNGIIAAAEQRLESAPIALPTAPNADRDDYLRVALAGTFAHGEESYFLSSKPPFGPGFNIITPFDTKDGRRILVDRGFVPQTLRDPAARTETTKSGLQELEGVLRWPQDTSFWTPEANLSKREWYSREVAPLAQALGTEPVLVVEAAADRTGWPRGSEAQVNIRNQHLPYAVQWFAIAAVWALMSLFWLRKVARSDAPE